MAARQPDGTSRFMLTFKFTDTSNPSPTEVTEFVLDDDADGAQAKVAIVYAAEGKTVVPNSYSQVYNTVTNITIA